MVRRRSRCASPALPRGLRLRLVVAIPLLVSCLVMLSGFVTLGVSYPLFFESTRPASVDAVEGRVVLAFLVVGGVTLLSLGLAVVLARSVAGPLRAFASRIESLRPEGAEGAGAAGDTELAALGSALEGVESSFSSLVLDSYTLRSLEGGVITTDEAGTVTSLNPVAEAVLGLAPSQALGRTLERVVPAGEPNQAFLAAIRGALVEGQRVSSAEATVALADGRTVELGYSLSPLRDEAGRPLGLVVTFKDLAERKAAERMMRRAENLALLGTMATSVAHEIRNPLGAMSGLVELLRDDATPQEARRQYCARILESIERINRICQELLTMGHPEPRDLRPLDINRVVQATLELCRYDAENPETEVRERYAPDLPPVLGDGERLGQVILNILRNAFQAVRHGGSIDIATEGGEETVAVAIHNTGPAIPPEVREKLFTLFFTTKKRGTGLGLAVSQHLVRAHGGRIRVASTPREGTTFTVELPVAGPVPAAAPCA
ncbi:MAG: two-component system sensor histidine kinase NtrB [Candidatus Brocadiia bacterium]